MRKWIDDANANPGPVKYVDILLQSQKHNKGAACYFMLTVLEAIPLRVKKQGCDLNPISQIEIS